jgi:hypothetical protein
MVVKLTQKQAEFLSTFGDFEDEENKRKALYHITHFGCGYNLTDGDDLKSGAFENSDKLKMVEAVINGYELIESKYKFYNFSDSSGGTPLYYAGLTNELKGNKKFALEVKKDSEEYKALLTLGFIEEEI